MRKKLPDVEKLLYCRWNEWALEETSRQENHGEPNDH